MRRVILAVAVVALACLANGAAAWARPSSKAPPPAKPLPEWRAIGRLCADTARKPASARALHIAETARDEFYYFGGHRIDSNGRLFSFGVVESEQEESDENIDTFRLGHLGWWQVLRYWRLLAEARMPLEAARQHLRLKGFAEATAEPDDKDIAKPARMGLDRALQAIDRIDGSLKLTRIEKEILKEALIRAAINDVAWSAAFISAVIRQAGLTDTEFEFSEAHNIYIYKAFQIALAEARGEQPAGYYRACPPARARPRRGDLLCYHRHVRQHGGKPAAVIRDLIVADLQGAKSDETIFKSHCDVVAHVDVRAARVYVVGGNVQQAVTVKKLVLDRRTGTLAEIQPANCRIDGAWTLPAATPGKPIAPHLSKDCSLNRKPWFVLLQARE